MSPQPETTAAPERRHQVVIIGSGFGGLNAAKRLKHANVDIKLIARTTHHLFQPLLYQVATGIVSEGDIAPPTRVILRRQRNVQVLLGDVTHIDLDGQVVVSDLLGHAYETPYDSLIVAAGAERSRDPERRARLLTFTVIGAGPTGVEMAGQIAELAGHTLKGSFRHIDSAKARVILLDAAPAVLPPFGEKLGHRAAARLQKMGVEIQLGAMVTDVDRNGVTVQDSDGTVRRIESACKVWSAGVSASGLGSDLAEQSSVELDRVGRVKVLPDLSIPGHPNVFVIGDMAAVEGVPGVAQGAIQGAKYVAGTIKAELRGADPADREPFQYFDKGSMATVSRFSAVAQVGPLEFSGFIAWLMWLVLHLVYLVGFKTKVSTLLSWTVTFLSTRRGQLTITEQQAFARTRLEQLAVLAAEAKRPAARRAS
jgi:NADH:ubiquinone reductase (H+-translocating)